MKFSQIPYERPDVEVILRQYDQITARCRAAKSAGEVLACFFEHEKLFCHAGTMNAYIYIRHSIDVNDPFFEQEQDFFCGANPLLNEKVQAFYRAVYDAPFRQELTEALGEVFFQNIELSLKAFTAENIPLMQEESRLCIRYSKLLASAAIDFDGETLNLEQLRGREESLDREVRRRAYGAEAAFFKQHEAEFDEIFDRLIALRTRMAKNLGFDNFIALGYCRMSRNCYEAEMVARYREQVVKDLLPAVCRVKARQAERIGLDRLMWYDDSCYFPGGNPRPCCNGDALLERGRQMYRAMGKTTGAFMDYMLENELFDALARPGKSNGGYCDYLPEYQMPFIFANFNGTADDVDTLTHEAGHALASYLARDMAVVEQMTPSLETCEVHSMSMEFFSYPYHELFYGADATRSRRMHMENALSFLPYGCIVDEFQHIIYGQPELTSAGRKAAWMELEKKYRPYLTFEGEFFGEGMWFMRQSHIYKNPFYYIDYCLAQTTALQFWRWAQHDRQEAFAAYMDLVKKAGTRTFTGLVAEAGLRSPFEEGCLTEVTKAVERHLLADAAEIH